MSADSAGADPAHHRVHRTPLPSAPMQMHTEMDVEHRTHLVGERGMGNSRAASQMLSVDKTFQEFSICLWKLASEPTYKPSNSYKAVWLPEHRRYRI